jgi:integrase
VGFAYRRPLARPAGALTALPDVSTTLPGVDRAELPPIRFHDLRHSCATIHPVEGKHPKYVQERLGHASISITLDTYSHVVEEMDCSLADAMHGAL